MSAPPRRSRPHFEHVQAALQRHAPGPIDTVASCRSTEFSKSETDRNGTMYRNVAQFTPFTPTYWVFRAISGPFQGHSRAISGPFQGHFRAIPGPFERENYDTTSVALYLAQAIQSSASQGSKNFSTTCQALGTCNYQGWLRFNHQDWTYYDIGSIRKSSKHVQRCPNSHEAIMIIGDAGLCFQIFQISYFT